MKSPSRIVYGGVDGHILLALYCRQLLNLDAHGRYFADEKDNIGCGR